MTAADGAGTAFDGTQSCSARVSTPGSAGGATGLLHASTQVDARGALRLLLDLRPRRQPARLGRLPRQPRGRIRAQPGLNCVPGATPVNFKLNLTPATATNPVGTAHTVTATLTDTGGTPIAGAPISFAVTGVNAPSPGNDTTDANGQATFTYTGTNTGQDQIAACYDADNNSAVRGDRLRHQGLDTSLRPQHHQDGFPRTAVVGGPITYTLTVANGGPSGASQRRRQRSGPRGHDPRLRHTEPGHLRHHGQLQPRQPGERQQRNDHGRAHRNDGRHRHEHRQRHSG